MKNVEKLCKFMINHGKWCKILQIHDKSWKIHEKCCKFMINHEKFMKNDANSWKFIYILKNDANNVIRYEMIQNYTKFWPNIT